MKKEKCVHWRCPRPAVAQFLIGAADGPRARLWLCEECATCYQKVYPRGTVRRLKPGELPDK